MTREELIWHAEQVADGAKAEILAEFKRVAGLAGIVGKQGGGISDTRQRGTVHATVGRGWRDLAWLVLTSSAYRDRLLEAANRPVITYPEHEKLAKVKDTSQAQGEFLDWLGGQGIHLMEWAEEIQQYVPSHRGITALLAEYHGIDQDALEQEKRQMLEAIRAQHQ